MTDKHIELDFDTTADVYDAYYSLWRPGDDLKVPFYWDFAGNKRIQASIFAIRGRQSIRKPPS